jgi:protein-tyrosine-phosphatase
LLARDGAGLPLQIHSLGLLSLGAAPALPEAVELAQAIGLDLSGHRARDLTQLDLRPVDLVLGFEQIHVSTAVVDGYAAIERTFTLPELVELLAALPDEPSSPEPVERARARIERAHALRSDERNRAVPEIADPLGRPRSAQRRLADEIRALVSELHDQLFD